MITSNDAHFIRKLVNELSTLHARAELRHVSARKHGEDAMAAKCEAIRAAIAHALAAAQATLTADD